jgi:hypothetical protein
MVAPVHFGVKKSLGPLEKPLEMSDYFSRIKNNLPHDYIRISDTFIVQKPLEFGL